MRATPSHPQWVFMQQRRASSWSQRKNWEFETHTVAVVVAGTSACWAVLIYAVLCYVVIFAIKISNYVLT